MKKKKYNDNQVLQQIRDSMLKMYEELEDEMLYGEEYVKNKKLNNKLNGDIKAWLGVGKRSKKK